EVIRRINAELKQCIDDLPPLCAASMATREPWPDQEESRSTLLLAPADGYVESVNYEQLAVLADEHDVFVRLDVRPGQFVCEDGRIGAIFPREAVSPALIHGIRGTMLIGPLRTPNQ